MSCLILGDMKGLTPSQRIQYAQAASVCKRVIAYNMNIRSQRVAGNKNASYYTFVDNNERNLYKMGQFILTQNDPSNAALYLDLQFRTTATSDNGKFI